MQTVLNLPQEETKMDDNEPKKPIQYQIGQDLSDMSVDELNALRLTLKEEISRIEDAANAKSSHLNAAEALFN